MGDFISLAITVTVGCIVGRLAFCVVGAPYWFAREYLRRRRDRKQMQRIWLKVLASATATTPV